MYEAFYGFREKPFNLVPDPDYLFMSKKHEYVYTHLQYAIFENKGFVVITGEIGSGKTTLIKFLLRRLKGPLSLATIYNTNLSPLEFLKALGKEFKFPYENLEKTSLLENLEKFLLQQYKMRKRVIVIIDEAQNLALETLEEIRLISNLGTEKESLLQIILVGQPELREKLKNPRLEQLVQRITVYCHLEGMNKEEVEKYIKHRLWRAGCKNLELFTKEAIDLICKYSRGIPRLINIICDTALVYGFADESPQIGAKIIEMVIKDKKNSGLFFSPKSPFQKEKSSLSLPKNKIDELEKRLQIMENLILHISKRLSFYQRIEKKLEELISELTKQNKK